LLKREELLFLFRWAIVINRIKNAINRENEEKKKKKERKKEENESNEKNGNVRRAVS
jgi:Na+-transporting methylmalonyl-CoA/oxaloacetate decarboxylase gamma subunit